jgi:putative hemolysin
MNEIAFEVLFIAVLILINGLFSMTEIAVVSARRVRLAGAAKDGNAGAAAAIKLQEKPERFLSTVQIGITLVGVLSGAFGGALLSDEFAAIVSQVPLLEPYANQIGFGIVIVIITYFSLVIGELVPKNLALNRPETIASLFSRPMNMVSLITAPVVWVLSQSTALVLKIFRIREATDSAITEEEIKAHIEHGREVGVFEETEQELIESVIKLDDQRITAIMTSRLKIVWLDLDDDIEINRQKLIDSPYSRMPACRGGLDEIVGIVKSRDLLAHFLTSGELDFETVLKDPVFVPETNTGLELLEVFKESHSLMAIVIDEFGAVVGVVTMNDVLEEIVGELPVGGVVNKGVTFRDDGSILIDGEVSIIDFRELLDLAELPEDERESYQTLAGFVLKRLEKLPVEGDKFEWEDYVFEVMDMDGRRVDKVLVTKTGDEKV